MCLDLARRLSMARVTNNIPTTDNFRSSIVLRFMQYCYCYCRRGTFPFRGRATVKLYHTSYNKRGAASATQALLSTHFTTPLAIHQTCETKLQFHAVSKVAKSRCG